MAEHAEAGRDTEGRVWLRCLDDHGRVVPYVDLVEAAPLWGKRMRAASGPAYCAAWEDRDDASLTYDFEVWNQ